MPSRNDLPVLVGRIVGVRLFAYQKIIRSWQCGVQASCNELLLLLFGALEIGFALIVEVAVTWGTFTTVAIPRMIQSRLGLMRDGSIVLPWIRSTPPNSRARKRHTVHMALGQAN